MKLRMTTWKSIALLIVGTLMNVGEYSGLVAQEPPLQDKSLDLRTPDSFPRFAPVEPADAESTFVVQHGFRMELIAAEPLVTDPVAMAVDEDGRAFVVEMNDYPYTDSKKHKAWAENPTDAPIGRVRLLEDRDGDGKFDRSTVFAEGLSWPSGIVCHRGGVIVTATPDIWYLKDTDGDGQADVRERWFTGFRKYNVQAVMNNPIWGMDNHVYVAGSSNGGTIRDLANSEQPPLVAKGDFRIDPKTHAIELQPGGARFGNTFDDWGNRFLCNIRNPAIQVVIDNRYLSRNPFFAISAATQNIAESGDQMRVYRISPVEPWRELRGKQWSADPTKKVPRSELTGGGVFTSTSGITVYRGFQYPSEFNGQIMVGEVANNTIYRQKIELDGASFKATRADEMIEFVASSDTWFRPVNLYNAPDGTLYVLDMYREFIEHPWSIPDDIHARLDLTSGRNRGRIYRLRPPNYQQQTIPKLSLVSSAELAHLLDHPAAWYRETSQRLIVERQDARDALLLRSNLATMKPRGVVHSLWTLDGLGCLTREDVKFALRHSSSQVRKQAVRLSEPWIEDDPELFDSVLKCAEDDDSHLRFQVALTLGSVPTRAAAVALAKVASGDVKDPWIQAAAGTAKPRMISEICSELIRIGSAPPRIDSNDIALRESTVRFIESLAAILGVMGGGRDAEMVLVAAKSNEEFRNAVLLGLGRGAKRKGRLLTSLFESQSGGKEQVVQFLENKRASILQSHGEERGRLSAMEFLGFMPEDQVVSTLEELIEPNESQAIQSAAIRVLSTMKGPAVAKLLVSRLKRFSPGVGEEAVIALCSRPDWALELLQAIEAGTVPSSMIGLARRGPLLANAKPEVQSLAKRVLENSNESRASVVDRYEMAMPARGDSKNGERVFLQQCASCHRIGNVGVEIGPHLETVRGWDRRRILLAILDPNREVTPQAISYSVSLTDGRVLAGLISDETATSLTLKRAGTNPETILRTDIEQLVSTGLSLMPVGVEETLSAEAMADLISFIQR